METITSAADQSEPEHSQISNSEVERKHESSTNTEPYNNSAIAAKYSSIIITRKSNWQWWHYIKVCIFCYRILIYMY